MPARKSILNTYIFVIANFILTFILIGILSGSFMQLTTGFYVLAPLVLGLSFYLVYYAVLQTKRFVQKQIGQLNYIWSLVFVIANGVLLSFNWRVWLDLFDGVSDMMIL